MLKKYDEQVLNYLCELNKPFDVMYKDLIKSIPFLTKIKLKLITKNFDLNSENYVNYNVGKFCSFSSNSNNPYSLRMSVCSSKDVNYTLELNKPYREDFKQVGVGPLHDIELCELTKYYQGEKTYTERYIYTITKENNKYYLNLWIHNWTANNGSKILINKTEIYDYILNDYFNYDPSYVKVKKNKSKSDKHSNYKISQSAC